MDLQLLLALVLGIATIVVLVLRTRLDAFVALLVAALLTGTVAGSVPTETLASITTGFGNTLGSIGIVIGLGIALGKILEVSGAADALARAFVRALGRGREPWALGGTGALVSIPVFADSAYVIMSPLAKSIARRKGRGYVALGLAMGGGMILTHHLVPPTPGPIAVVGIIGADIGAFILLGLVAAVLLLPLVVLYAQWVGPRLEGRVAEGVAADVYGSARAQALAGAGAAGAGAGAVATDGAGPGREDVEGGDGRGMAEPRAGAQLGEAPPGAPEHSVGAFRAFVPLLVPLALIISNTVGGFVDRTAQGVLAGEYEPSTWARGLAFVGNPVVALIIGLVIAVYGLLPRWVPRHRVSGWLADAAAAAGLIILITGAGGALGQVLRDSGVGDELATAVASTPLPGVLVPFLIASVVRLAQGSGTVAMITAASVSAPLVPQLGLAPLAAAFACCAGSMVFAYFSDSFFWVITRLLGLEGTDALKGWSGTTTVAWAGSIPLVLLAGAVL
ncbi:GntP family permease [Pseudokineococcus sp. 1T1Z-3]|uniref:GntP family permease n=1 Tax=Pseudokineococcus sp. 1T1Z-3 TaxID=3132745 RepID=UPI0030B6D4F1